MAPPNVKMLSTTWCGHCRRLKRQLDEAGIDYAEIDIDQEPELAARIEAITGGFRVVPTLEIDGSLLVNPSIGEVRAALGGVAPGFHVS